MSAMLSDAWSVLALFLIPVGGGIPAGVLRAQSLGIGWPVMMILYLISDIILACVFEPMMNFFIFIGRRVQILTPVVEAFRKAVKRSTSHYGNSAGPVALVMISFGVDPMTGRAAAVAAGHGFVTGWMIAIAGDMIFFTLVMISTLWLSSVLGDGTWTMLIILALMVGIPPLIRRVRARKTSQ